MARRPRPSPATTSGRCPASAKATALPSGDQLGALSPSVCGASVRVTRVPAASSDLKRVTRRQVDGTRSLVRDGDQTAVARRSLAGRRVREPARRRAVDPERRRGRRPPGERDPACRRGTTKARRAAGRLGADEPVLPAGDRALSTEREPLGRQVEERDCGRRATTRDPRRSIRASAAACASRRSTSPRSRCVRRGSPSTRCGSRRETTPGTHRGPHAPSGAGSGPCGASRRTGRCRRIPHPRCTGACWPSGDHTGDSLPGAGVRTRSAAAARASERDPAARRRPCDRTRSAPARLRRLAARGPSAAKAAERESKTGRGAHGPIFAAPLAMLRPMTSSAEAGIS